MTTPTQTNVLCFGGAETGFIDAVNTFDGDLVDMATATSAMFGANVSIASGALTGNGGRHYHVDTDGTGKKGHIGLVTGGVPSGSATQIRTVLWVAIWTNSGEAATDFIFAASDSAATPGWSLKYEGATDGKVHFFVGATEIDSAHAWTPNATRSASYSLGTAFGVRMTWDINGVSPFHVKVDKNLLDGNGWVAQQSGTTTTVYPTSSTRAELYLMQDLGKVGSNNAIVDFDDIVIEDNSQGAFDDNLIDIVINGVPASDSGTYNQLWNSAGTACSVGGANCYAAADEVPATTVDYFVDNSTTNATRKQTFPVTNTLLHSYDVPCSARLACLAYGATVNSNTIGYVIYNAVENNFGALIPTTTSPAWSTIRGTLSIEALAGAALTEPLLTGMEIGVWSQHVVGVTNDVRIHVLHQVVAYKVGTPSGIPNKIVQVNQAVNRAGNY